MKQVGLLGFKLVSLPTVAYYIEEKDSCDEALTELLSITHDVLKG